MGQIHHGGQVKRSGEKTRADIRKTSPTAIPRDDLHSAYAGDKNRGPAGSAQDASKGTSTRGRRLRKDEGKEPVR